MHDLKIGESFDKDGYTMTCLGAGKKGSPSDWALMCCAKGNCQECDSEKCYSKEKGEKCECPKTHAHFWVKKGHEFSAGSQGYKMDSCDRDGCSISESDGKSCGLGDC